MKFLIILSLLVTTQAFALNCQTEMPAGDININIDQEQGNVAYLYTTGRIICPASIDYFIGQKSPFRCVGLWDYDYDRREHETAGEPLSIEFNHDGNGYVATFSASKVHKNKKLKMVCN